MRSGSSSRAGSTSSSTRHAVVGPRADGQHIRTTANVKNMPCLTTVAAARAAGLGIAALKDGPMRVVPLQDHHNVDQQQLRLMDLSTRIGE